MAIHRIEVRCDRCGHEFFDRTFRIEASVRVGVEGGDRAVTPRVLDLCQGCELEFIDWIVRRAPMLNPEAPIVQTSHGVFCCRRCGRQIDVYGEMTLGPCHGCGDVAGWFDSAGAVYPVGSIVRTVGSVSYVDPVFGPPTRVFTREEVERL